MSTMYPNSTNGSLPEEAIADRALTRRLREGDADAYETAFRLYHRYLLRIAVRYLKDEELAEDALQEVFVKLWLFRDRLDESHSIKAFLSVALKNQVLNDLRSQKRRILHHLASLENWSEEDHSTENQQVWREYLDILTQGISYLTPQRREVFRLRVEEGLTNEEVADRLNLSVNTVKFQFYHASKFLRHYLHREAAVPSALFLAALAGQL
jgi:RNA polymerase sigma-70 factor (family 1)